MNMKKIIPLSFAALSVAGAISACSDSTVSGVDVQDNSMAQRSSSSVAPGSSSSSGIPNDALSQIVARLKELKSNVPIIVSKGYMSWTTPSGSVDSSRIVVDSVDAFGTFNRYRDFIVDKGELKPQEFDLDSMILSFVAMRDEKSVVHGPYFFFDTGCSRQFICESLVNLQKREQGQTSWYDKAEEYAFSLAPSWGGSEIVPGKYELSRLLTIYDSSVVDLFKRDCAADNGSFSKSSSGGIIYKDELGNVTEYIDSIYVCKKEITMAENADVYKDPYWQKYVSIIFDRCVGPLDSLTYDPFGKPEDSNESEQ